MYYVISFFDGSVEVAWESWIENYENVKVNDDVTVALPSSSDIRKFLKSKKDAASTWREYSGKVVFMNGRDDR